MSTLRLTCLSRTLRQIILAATVSFAVMSAPAAHAHNASEASMTLSALPIASVVVASGAGASLAGAASTAAVTLPVALAVAGSQLVVVGVQVIASGTVYVLERVSDGARATIALAGASARSSAYAVGTTVEVSLISAGTLLSVAGEIIAFVPNEIGRSLLCNERLTFDRHGYGARK